MDAREHLLQGLDCFLSEKEEEWRLGLGEQNESDVGSIYAASNCSQADLVFQVLRIVRFKVVRVEKTRTT